MIEKLVHVSRRSHNVSGVNFIHGDNYIDIIRDKGDESDEIAASSIFYDITNVRAKFIKISFECFCDFNYFSNMFTIGFDKIKKGTYKQSDIDVFKKNGEVLDSQRFSVEISSSYKRRNIIYIPVDDNDGCLKFIISTSKLYGSSNRKSKLSIFNLKIDEVELLGDDLEGTINSYELSKMTIISPELKWSGRFSDNKVNVVFSSVNVPIWKYQLNHILDSCMSSSLYINDSQSQWYQDGLQTLGGNKFHLIMVLNLFINKIDCGNINFIGLSMGAFGALEYGKYCRVNQVYAFNPDSILLEPGSRSVSFIKGNKYSSIDLIDLINGNNIVYLYFSKLDTYDRKTYQRVVDENLANACVKYLDSGHNIGSLFEEESFLLDIIKN